MSKIFKNTAVLSLGLAGLIIIAHMLIPHDHNFDTSAYDKHSEHHHCCHALNILTDNKHTPLLEFHAVFHYLDFSSFDFLPFKAGESTLTCLLAKSFRFREFNESPETSDLLKISSLRAPPSLV
ncbi:MAG: hypothetical protein WCX48_07400 [Bacteroidales bacterium]